MKLKICAIDFESELTLIQKLRQRYSADDIELRVDANGAFSPDEALSKLQQLATYHLHSIEQPIRQGQWEEMAKLCAQTPLPIALDEELIGVNDPQQKEALLDTIRPHYLVLKPSLHGAFTGAAEWMNLARERGIGYWTTSALESNIGLNAIAQWCAAIDGNSPLPQGLGTGQLFETNARTPISMEGDCLWFGDAKQRAFEAEIADFKLRWLNDSPTMTVHTSGSTGTPQRMEAEKVRMWASAQATIRALGLQPNNTALLCMPLKYIAGQMMLVRAFAAPLQLVAVAPTSHPYARLHDAPDFAALTPMQVFESLKVPHERALLRRTLCLIIGGGALSPELEAALKNFPNPVWSTYGMTETLSHIALRRVNGPEASDSYCPLPGVAVSLSEQGTLVIDAPEIADRKLFTNDLAELLPNGHFRLIGRRDNVVCSGGIKLHLEQIEKALNTLPVAVQLTAVPDARLGEALTLLYVADTDRSDELETTCRQLLDAYSVPRHYLRITALPTTETGKPARAAARTLAQELLQA